MPITVIKSVLLFDGHEVHENATVTFDSESGIIKSVSDSAESIPSGAKTIDGKGHTLLPGLIDAHVHAHALHLPSGADATLVLQTPIKSGVTTICDMHCDPTTIKKYKDTLNKEVEDIRAAGVEGKVTLCDLKSSLFAATIEGGWPKPVVLGHNPTDEIKAFIETWPTVTVEKAGEYIRNQIENGADYIKLMQENCCAMSFATNSIPSATLELQTAVVKEAHDKNLLVFGHATSIEATEIVLKSGADGLTHTIIDQPPTDEIIRLHKEKNACVIPTLVIHSSLTGENADLRQKFANLGVEKGILDDSAKQAALDVLGMGAETSTVENAYLAVRKLREAGVDIVAGTDSAAGLKGTAPGPSLWMELELYVNKCGMNAIEALKSATSVTARRFKFHDRGSVEAGKRADLVLVKGDVTQRLQCLWEGEGVVGVWKQGLRAV